MEDRKVLRKRSVAVVKATIWGALLFSGVFLLALQFRSFEIPYLIALLMSSLPEYIRTTTGWNAAPSTSASAVAFEAIVNALCGGIIFLLGAVVVQIISHLLAKGCCKSRKRPARYRGWPETRSDRLVG
jgi:hypothetical protein